MSFLSNIVKKVKSNFSDDKGFFRGNKFTPVTQLTGKPLLPQSPQQLPQQPNFNQNMGIGNQAPQFPTLEPPKPSFKTASADKLNSRLDMIKRFGTSSVEKLKPILDNQFKIASPKTVESGKNIITKTLPTFAKEIATPMKNWATTTGQEIMGKSGQDLKQLEQDEAVNQKILDNRMKTYQDLLVQGRDNDAANMRLKIDEMLNQPSRFKKFEEDIETKKNQYKADAIKTGMTVAGAGKPVAIPSLLLASGFGAGGAALQGEDPYTAAGKSMANAQRWRGVTQFTDPTIGKIVNTVVKPEWSEMGRQVASRLISGTGNIYEDRLIDKLEGTERGAMDDLSSFVIGAIMSNGGRGAGKFEKGDFKPEKIISDIKTTLGNDLRASGRLNSEELKALNGVVDRIISIGVGKDGDLSSMRGSIDPNAKVGLDEPKKYYFDKYADKVLEVNPNTYAHKGEPIFDTLEQAQKVASSPRELMLARDAWKKSHPTDWIGNEISNNSPIKTGGDVKISESEKELKKMGYTDEDLKDMLDEYNFTRSDKAVEIKNQVYQNEEILRNIEDAYIKKFGKTKLDNVKNNFANNYKINEARDTWSYTQRLGEQLKSELNQPKLDKPKTELDWKIENNKKPETTKSISDIFTNRKTEVGKAGDVTKLGGDDNRPLPPKPKPFVDYKKQDSEILKSLTKQETPDVSKSDFNAKQVSPDIKNPERIIEGEKIKQVLLGNKSESILNKGEMNSYIRAKDNPELARKLYGIEQPVKTKPQTTKVTTQEPIVAPKPSSEVVEPKKTKINEVLPTKKTIKDKITDFEKAQPPKKTVIGKSAEIANKNLTTQGHSLVEQITEGIKKTNTSKKDFIKYIQNPELAPKEIKPAIEAHRKLMEASYNLRENEGLGVIENYYPRMSNDSLDTPSELKNIGDDLFISSKTMELGTSKKRTGSMTDYSQEYDKVMKEYINQTAYDKYGKRIGMTEADSKFGEKLEEHLKPVDNDGNLQKPNDKFDYINEVSVKDNVVKKEKIRAKANPMTTFDSFRREISKEAGTEKLNKSMEDVRDVEDKVFELIAKMEKLDTKEKVKLLIDNLDYLKTRPNVVESLKRMTNINNSTVNSLLKAEKDLKVQNFITESSKYDFEPQTQKYLNKEIDKMTKIGRYKQNLLDKATNLITGTFYRAQIWGNVSTGLKQKGESLRLPVLYSLDKIKAGTKQWNLDRKSGRDILADYDFKNLSTDYSKQLGIDTKGESKISRAGNFFVNAGESSKNRDFLYVAEAEGKANGLSGDELKRFVRNELFANGFILHKFHTPKMLNNPLIRLGLQYQQYNMKTITRALELNHQGEHAKAVGIIGTQAASALLLLGITNAGIETAKNGLGIGIGPAASLPYQVGKYLYDNSQKDEDRKQPIGNYLTKTAIRNVIPFGNQLLKSYGAGEKLISGRGESSRGRVNYVVNEKNPIKIAQALTFGQNSLDDKKEADKKWRRLSKDGIYPTLTEQQSAVLKSLPKEKQREYYDRQMELQTKTKDIVSSRTEEKKPGLIKKIFNRNKVEAGTSLVPPEGATPEEYKKFESIVKEFIDAGSSDKVKPEEWNSYYFRKVDNMPESTAIEKHQKEIDRWKKITSIENNEDIPKETRDSIIANSGASKADIEYYKNASLDNGSRKQLLVKLANQKDRDSVIQALIESKRIVGNKAMASAAEIDYLYDKGLISKEEKALINSWKFDEVNNEFYQDIDFKGSGGSGSAKRKSKITSLNALFKTLSSNTKSNSQDKSINNYLTKGVKKTEPKTIGSIFKSTLNGEKNITQNVNNLAKIKRVKRIPKRYK